MERIERYSKNGKPKIEKIREFRAPRPEDEVGALVQQKLEEMEQWQASNVVPNRAFPPGITMMGLGNMVYLRVSDRRFKSGSTSGVELMPQLKDGRTIVRASNRVRGPPVRRSRQAGPSVAGEAYRA